ncbi:MAG: aldolase [Methanoregulaceae archaeon]|jgi:L-fuculose-phosphate aldolase
MFTQDFKRIGKRLFDEHLVGGNFGNISIKVKNGMYITSTGSFLDDPGDLVLVNFEGEVPPQTSSEFRVHRQIYRKTQHSAIVHAHPPYAVAASLVFDNIIPKDSEGQLLCPSIPVVVERPGSDELAQNVANSLIDSNLVIARGHGTFAAGKSLNEAYLFTSLAEYSCRVITFEKDLKK